MRLNHPSSTAKRFLPRSPGGQVHPLEPGQVHQAAATRSVARRNASRRVGCGQEAMITEG